MTQHVPTIPSVRLAPRHRRRDWLIGLVLAVAIATTGTVLLVSGDSGTSVSSSHRVSASLGGPNETLRGSAVATASGASTSLSTTGGVNEAARGQAAARASSSPSRAGGVDETARGQAAASASR